MKAATSRTRSNGPHITNGKPRPGGRLDNFTRKQDPRTAPVHEGDFVYVSVDGQHPRKAVLHAQDFLRITKDMDGPRLTRSRWWLDDDGYLRAFSLHQKPFQHGVLVAAAILGVKAGDTIEVPADPLDLRLDHMQRV